MKRISAWLALCASVAVILLLGCGQADSNHSANAGSPPALPVQAWVTLTDQSMLLQAVAGLQLGSAPPLALNIEVDTSKRYQEMVGFGASISDASAWLIQNRMNAQQRAVLLQDLFGPAPGIGLSFTRLTIGASDFSLRHYSLDDMPSGESDYSLERFSIDPLRAEVLPVVKAALAINPKLKVMASPWSAPAWMKTSDSLIGGTLRPQAHAVFSAYLGRFADAMESEGIPLFALTLQNEPHFEPADYPGMRLDSASRAKLIGEHLGPLLAARSRPLRLLEWDHNWDQPQAPLDVLADAKARPYVAGVAWHCYAGAVAAQSLVHDSYPDKETYFTECSGGEWSPSWSQTLPWLVRHLIIGSTRGWAKGVLLWNMALDEKHGPHLGGCKDCRGVLTIHSSSGEVTRNAEYFALAHASRFVRPGARRIESGSGLAGIETVAFQNADDSSIALIVLNTASEGRSFSVSQGGQTFVHSLPAAGVATFVWNPH